VKHLAWVRAYARIVDGHGDQPCPRCREGVIGWRIIGDLETRIGYAVLWCTACAHGTSISRLKAAPGMPMRAFDDPAATDGIPEVTQIR
jgi:hypothetical protein